MTVPLAMRAQHNQTQAQIQSGLAELDKINSLTEHTPELTERKNMLIKNIDALSSDLSNKGFSNDMTSSVIKLNRNIKDELGPQGRLGQINNAYSVYQKNFEEFKKSNADKKWDDDRMKANWASHSASYKGYDGKGDITNISSLSAPEKVSITDKWKDLSTIMGDAKIATEVMTGGADITGGPDGSTMIVTSKNGSKKSYNNPQVVAALREIHGELNDPTSDLSKSRVYSGQSMGDALREAYNIGGSKIDIASGRTSTIEKSLQGVRNSNDVPDEGMETVDVSNGSRDVAGTLGSARSIVNTLSKKDFNKLTDDEKESYYENKGMLNSFEKIKYNHASATSIKTSDGRNAAVKAFQELFPKGGTGQKGRPNQGITYKKVEEMKNTANASFLKGFTKGTPEYKVAEMLVKGGKDAVENYNSVTAKSIINPKSKIDHNTQVEVLKKWNRGPQKVNKVFNNYSNDLYTHTNNYKPEYTTLLASADSKIGKAFKEIDRNLTTAFKSSDALNSLGSITEFTDEDGNLSRITGSGDRTAKRTAVSKALKTAKTIEPVSFSPNDRGYPSMKFLVTPEEGSESESTGGWGSTKVGGAKAFEMVIRLDKLSNVGQGMNKYGTNALIMQKLKLMAQSGDQTSRQMATDMVNAINALDTK